MTHKPGPEQVVSVNEGKAVTVGVSLLNKYEGTPDKEPVGSIQPFESTLGWAVRRGGSWPCSGRLGLGRLPPARQSPASHCQAAPPGALLLNFTIHMLNLQFSFPLAKL